MACKEYDIDAVEFYTRPIPQVHIIDANFAFTGSFKFGFQQEVVCATENVGGRFAYTIPDYLVVGEKLKKNQILPFKSHQVTDALEKNDAFGAQIAIIPEFAWLAGLQTPTQFSRKDQDTPLDEVEIWAGSKLVRFAYSDAEGKYDGSSLIFRIVTVRANANRREYFFEGYKEDDDFSGFLAHRIASDVTDLETEEVHSPEQFFRALTGRPCVITYCPPN